MNLCAFAVVYDFIKYSITHVCIQRDYKRISSFRYWCSRSPDVTPCDFFFFFFRGRRRVFVNANIEDFKARVTLTVQTGATDMLHRGLRIPTRHFSGHPRRAY